MHDAEISFPAGNTTSVKCHRNNPNAKLERCDSISPATYVSTSNADIGTLLTALPMLSRTKTVVFDQWQQV